MKTLSIHQILIAMLLLLGAGRPAVQAQIRGNHINVTIQPDHRDWNYRLGEQATFSVQVLRSGTPVDGASVDIEAGPEMYPDEVRRNVELKDGTLRWKGRLTRPGFYRLKVTAHVGGRDYVGLCTAAFAPEQLRPYAQMPRDFRTFWDKSLAEARRNGLDATCTLLPERCTQEVQVYEVSYVADRPGSRFYGILSVPVKPGRYPAVLRVPGAGVRPYAGDVWTASQGCITLEVGIHGVPVTMAQQVYDRLAGGALNGYWNRNVDDPLTNYYHRVVIGAVRAVDYIATLPQWNGQRLAVTGSSQGGFLSLAVAALDSRVTCLAVVHDAMCDYEAELHRVAGGWPHYYLYGPKASQARIEGARYYDGVNFARLVRVPGWYSFGYNDEVVPPTSAYATYNTVTAPKTLSVYQQTGHYWYQEQWDEWQEWLLGQVQATDRH